MEKQKEQKKINKNIFKLYVYMRFLFQKKGMNNIYYFCIKGNFFVYIKNNIINIFYLLILLLFIRKNYIIL